MSEKLAFARASEALLGGVVALLVLFLFPQRVPLATTRNAVVAWATELQGALESAAQWLADPGNAPFDPAVATLHDARQGARLRVNEMNDAVSSQWARKGSGESRRMVMVAYEALARIHVYAASSLFLLERLSVRLGDSPYARSREELSAVLHEIALAVEQRTAGHRPTRDEVKELDADLDRLATSATSAITSREPMAWEAMALLTNIQAIRSICRQ